MTPTQRLQRLEPPRGCIDLVLDTDAYNEVDDQFAIAYALRSPESIRLQALYAAPFHNDRSTGPADGMEKSHEEILRLLALTRDEVPVFRGSTAWLANESQPVDSPAARDLIARAMHYTPEQPLYVAAIGAITNVASALLMKPEIAERIVVIFQGMHSLSWGDNQEFNTMQDVAAARVVFASGAPLVILPAMGVVHAFHTSGPELTYWLQGKNALCDFLLDRVLTAANAYAAGKPWTRTIWDVTSIAWLVDRTSSFTLSRLEPTPIPEYDHRLSCDPRRPLCRYVYYVNRDAIFGDLFSKLAR